MGQCGWSPAHHALSGRDGGFSVGREKIPFGSWRRGGKPPRPGRPFRRESAHRNGVRCKRPPARNRAHAVARAVDQALRRQLGGCHGERAERAD